MNVMKVDMKNGLEPFKNLFHFVSQNTVSPYYQASIICPLYTGQMHSPVREKLCFFCLFVCLFVFFVWVSRSKHSMHFLFYSLFCFHIRFGGTCNSEMSLNSQTPIWIHGQGSVNSDTLLLLWILALTETIRYTTRYALELSLMFTKDLSVQINFLSVQIL